MLTQRRTATFRTLCFQSIVLAESSTSTFPAARPHLFMLADRRASAVGTKMLALVMFA